VILGRVKEEDGVLLPVRFILGQLGREVLQVEAEHILVGVHLGHSHEGLSIVVNGQDDRNARLNGLEWYAVALSTKAPLSTPEVNTSDKDVN
jgi:hypothetical protein